MRSIWCLLCAVVALMTAQVSAIIERDLSIDEVIMNAYESPQAADFIQDANTLLVELDIRLSPEQWEERVNPNYRSKRAGLSYGNWPHNTVPYDAFPHSFDQSARNAILGAIDEYHRYTCVNFRPKNRYDTAYVYFSNEDGCSSALGYANGPRKMTLPVGCRSHGTIVHEFGHALGLHHEQTRPDRDEYVTLNKTNIIQKLFYNFDKYGSIDSREIPYDFLSVMHYGNDYFAVDKSQYTLIPRDQKFLYRIGQRKGLSFEDIKLLNLKYGCNGRCGNKKCPEDGFLSKDCTCWCKRNIEFGEPVALCDTGARVPGGKDDGGFGECKDIYNQRDCRYYKKINFCSDSRAEMMMEVCRKTCGWCTPEWTTSATNIGKKTTETGGAGAGGSGGGNKGQEITYGQRSCQGATMRLDCDGGLIKIKSAMYGRQSKDACPDRFSYETGCEAPDSLDTVNDICDGRTRCTIHVNDDIFRRVCPHLSKYLQVVYTCQNNGRVTTTPAPVTTTTPAPTVAPEGCNDFHALCDFWQSKRYCSHAEYGPYVRQQCRKSCNLCGQKCRDRASRCDLYTSREGACESNPAYMREYCQRSCNYCGKRKYARGPCRDANKNCAPWVNRGMCRDNKDYMEQNCAKSCGFCGRKNRRQ